MVKKTNTQQIGYYDAKMSLHYYQHPETRFFRRFSNRREISIARKSLKLAGKPRTVLDIPCGTGRFWDMLMEESSRTVYAADLSEHMLKTGLRFRNASIIERIHLLQANAHGLPLRDDSVDCIFCMRLLHHLATHDQRLYLLKEFRRTTRETLCISLWLNGNYKSYRKKRKKRIRADSTGTWKRGFLPADLAESEFREAGFEILGRVFFLRFYSMWCVYTLKKVQVG